jgi:hypothetical protein
VDIVSRTPISYVDEVVKVYSMVKNLQTLSTLS